MSYVYPDLDQIMKKVVVESVRIIHWWRIIAINIVGLAGVPPLACGDARSRGKLPKF
jgi:hypothetical protein